MRFSVPIQSLSSPRATLTGMERGTTARTDCQTAVLPAPGNRRWLLDVDESAPPATAARASNGRSDADEQLGNAKGSLQAC